MNFFPGMVVEAEAGGGLCHVEMSGALLGATLPGAAAPGASVPGASVTVAVRPERIRLHAVSEGVAGLPGTLLDSIYLGSARRLVVGLAGGRDCHVLRPADAAPIAPGQPVTLSWDAAHAAGFPG